MNRRTPPPRSADWRWSLAGGAITAVVCGIYAVQSGEAIWWLVALGGVAACVMALQLRRM